MYRIVWLCLAFFLTLTNGVAQFTNDWISFGQPYVKIPVAKNGIYRISYDQLQQAGFPVASIDPKKLQVFHRGIQQAILVNGEGDNQFGSDDYVEFFAKQNDGTLDALLFKSPKKPANPYFNLYSDTTYYFLTAGLADGKRMALAGGSNTGLPAATYHLAEKLLVLSNNYSSGTNVNNEIFTSTFETGEGWTSAIIAQGQSRDFVFDNVTQIVSSGPQPTLEINLTGRNFRQHAVEIYVGPSMRLLSAVTLPEYDPTLVTFQLQWADISPDGKVTVRVQVPNQGSVDYVSVSHLKLNFPQQTDLGSATEKTFTFPSGPSGELYFELHNPAPSTRLFDITQTDDTKLVETILDGPLKAMLTNASTSRVLFAANTVLTPTRVVPVTFRQINPQLHNYIIISHPLLRKPGGGYADPVKAYAEYRASEQGGGFDTLTVYTQQLFDQFSYGERTSVGIYKFIEYLSATNKPSYLLLIGKGLELWYQYYRTSSSNTWEHQDLVPTAGFPGSDLTFSMGIGDPDFQSAIPTGRIPAMKSEQVAAYLNKVKETESQPFDNLWRKRLLHLSGGIEDWEPAAFKSFLEDFKTIAEGPYLGGTVTSIAKESRDVQVINIAEQVNQGLGLVTFFGHSSTSTLDFDIGYVSNPVLGYNNSGKYPMLLMNGCDVGAFFLRTNLFGEDWVLADKKGATGFIAHNAWGLVPNLYRYSHNFYSVAFADSVFIRKGIGDIHRETARRFMEGYEPSVANLSQIQQMILLADPAVKLFGASKPDLVIKENQLAIHSFDGDPVTVASDSFAIKMIVSNYGMAKPGLFRVEVSRTLPDNTTILYDSIFNIPYNTDTLLFIVRKGRENGSGNNTFHIKLDADEIITELNESNNVANYVFPLPLNGTKHLYPSDFAIVTQREINLSWQATDPYSDLREFIIEIDTIPTFNSSFKKQFTVQGKVLALQQAELLDSDTLAYYWRTRLTTPNENESGDWVTSTFTHIAESKEGWAQVHFPQYLKNTTVGLLRDEDARLLQFEKSVTPISIRTYGSSSGKNIDSVSVKIAGAEYNLFTQGFNCRLNTINLVAFDRKSTAAYIGVYLKWYEILWTYGGRRMACGREPHVINSFAHNETVTGKHDLIAYIDNVAEGDSVVLYTTGNASISLWPDAAKSKVGEIGISLEQLSSIQDGEPIVIFARKGAPAGSANIFRSDSANPLASRLKIDRTITGGYSSGVMNSTLIGPAQEWDSFKWKSDLLSDGDEIRFDVIGIKLNSEEVILFENALGDQDLTSIDAETYPYLKIVFNVGDELLLTPAQLENWIVHFTPVPEGVLLPMHSRDVVQISEGESYVADFAFLNITDKQFPDSLDVNFSFFNQPKSQSVGQSFKIKSPEPLDTTFFQVHQSTANRTGLNDIELFVNPRKIPEQHYDNNIIQRSGHVNVLGDVFPPVTDVTFDGKYITNGDFVSSNPLIRIRIWDDNNFLLKNDTIGVRMFLTKTCEPDPCPPQYISFRNPYIEWHPAMVDSDFFIDFTPQLEEGKYLLSVEAADKKGNKASSPFEIEFVVDNESVLTLLTPYPNPFYTDLYYGFSLSGNSPADEVSFEIVDLTGKVIYTNTTTSALSVGRNIFYWDGLDSQGRKLQSGIFLYRMTVSLAGTVHRKQGKIAIQR